MPVLLETLACSGSESPTDRHLSSERHSVAGRYQRGRPCGVARRVVCAGCRDTGLVADHAGVDRTYRGVPVHAPGGCSPTWRRSCRWAERSPGSRCCGIGRPARAGGVDADDVAGLDRIDADRLDAVRRHARRRGSAWAAGAGPDLDQELRLTSTPPSPSRTRRRRTRRQRGTHVRFYPLLCFLDRPDIAGGRRWPGCCGPGTPARTLPPITSRCWTWRWPACPPRPAPALVPGGPRLVARSDSAGATHAFAQACVARGVGFSFGFPVDHRIQRIVDVIPEQCWHPALQADRGDTDGVREGAWVAEATGMIDLSSWPAGSRLILRKERPHPGAQLTFTDTDGMRVTAILTNTGPGSCPARQPGWSCGTASTPASRTASAKPRPPACATCPAGLQREPSMARGRPVRRRPGGLDQDDLLRRRPSPGPLRNRNLPLPRAARRRPTHPRRPTAPATHRQDLALGHPHRRRLPPTPRRVHLTTRDPARPTRRPGEPPPGSASRATRTPTTSHHARTRQTGHPTRLLPSRVKRRG